MRKIAFVSCFFAFVLLLSGCVLVERSAREIKELSINSIKNQKNLVVGVAGLDYSFSSTYYPDGEILASIGGDRVLVSGGRAFVLPSMQLSDCNTSKDVLNSFGVVLKNYFVELNGSEAVSGSKAYRLELFRPRQADEQDTEKWNYKRDHAASAWIDSESFLPLKWVFAETGKEIVFSYSLHEEELPPISLVAESAVSCPFSFPVNPFYEQH